MLTSVGTASMITFMHYFTTEVVVKNTMIENMKVQIGSTICHLGFQRMIPAAIMTPTDWIRSPRIWISAALWFKFLVSVCSCS